MATWAAVNDLEPTAAQAVDIAVVTGRLNNLVDALDGTDTLTATKFDLAADFKVGTTKFTVAYATGNTLVAGTLNVTSDFKINTDKFTVTASSGNTLIAGTLGVTGAITGNITGNCSGTAATVTGATQASITTCANLVSIGTIGTGVWQGTTIKANYLQSAAADLGAANVEVNLSNSNGSYVTNLTLDGSLNVGGATGSLSKINVLATTETTLGTSNNGIFITTPDGINNIGQLGFGYGAAKTQAYIAYVQKTTSGFEHGNLVFGTKADTTDTYPTTRMTINSVTGNIDIAAGLNIGSGGSATAGSIYAQYDVSAATFTDRTPFYEGDAVSVILAIKGKDGEIDHSTLPTFAKIIRTKDILQDEEYEEDETELIGDKSVITTKTKTRKIKVGEEDRVERDLGAMISVLTVAVQQLTARIEKLEKK